MFTVLDRSPGKRLLLAMLLAGLCPFSHALTFDEAIRIAQEQAPQLTASAQNVAASRSMQIAAGELPDPKIALGIENLPIEGDDRFELTSDPMTMRRIGLMQEFPNQAKREARVAAARGQVAAAEAQASIARLAVQRETAIAWVARANLERQLARIDALSEENRLFDAAVRAQFAGGKAMTTEIVAPRQEAAMIEERKDELRARRGQAIAALRRWVGKAADAPLQGAAPDWPIARDMLEQHLLHHPELLAFDSKERVLDAEIAEAQAEKKPDWALELAYQMRGEDYGDMASVMVSFDLPLFTATRQDPKIAAKGAERASLDAEREMTLREHAAMLEADWHEHQRLANAVRRQRELLLPLANEKVDLAMAAWRGGKGSLTDLIAARRERIDAELKAIALEGERQQMAARLHYAYGNGATHHTGEQQ